MGWFRRGSRGPEPQGRYYALTDLSAGERAARQVQMALLGGAVGFYVVTETAARAYDSRRPCTVKIDWGPERGAYWDSRGYSILPLPVLERAVADGYAPADLLEAARAEELAPMQAELAQHDRRAAELRAGLSDLGELAAQTDQILADPGIER